MALRLPNLRGLHARVETVQGRFDVVTSRAFASLVDFTAWSRKALQPGAVWMAMKGKHPTRRTGRTGCPVGQPSEAAWTFHVEPLHRAGLDAERCMVWMRPAPDKLASFGARLQEEHPCSALQISARLVAAIVLFLAISGAGATGVDHVHRQSGVARQAGGHVRRDCWRPGCCGWRWPVWLRCSPRIRQRFLEVRGWARPIWLAGLQNADRQAWPAILNIRPRQYFSAGAHHHLAQPQGHRVSTWPSSPCLSIPPPTGAGTFGAMAATIAALTFLYGLIVTLLTHHMARLRANPRCEQRAGKSWRGFSRSGLASSSLCPSDRLSPARPEAALLKGV